MIFNKKPKTTDKDVLMVSRITNTRRRNVLKLVFFGVTALILGKIVDPSLNLFSRPREMEGEVKFKNFRVIEGKKELTLYNTMGDKIFIIEKSTETG